MVGKGTASVLTILGGLFYMMGATMYLGMTDAPLPGSATYPDVGLGLFYSFLIGEICGALIIIGGAMIASSSPRTRRAGAVLSLAMMLLGGVPAFAGFGIGLILIAIGGVLGLTYRPPTILGATHQTMKTG